MKYNNHKKYFNTAYKTGSDIWTSIEKVNQGKTLTNKLSVGAMVLDIGSGRGIFTKKLADDGYQVIGMDFENEIVDKLNKEIKNWNLFGKLRFVEGDVLDIPFTDDSFDAVCDFGLLEYLYKEDWKIYKDEIYRVLKKGGYYLNLSISRDTDEFLGFNPKSSKDGEFEKYGVHYHFFKEEELKNIFEQDFKKIEQNIIYTDLPLKLVLIETLYQK